MAKGQRKEASTIEYCYRAVGSILRAASQLATPSLRLQSGTSAALGVEKKRKRIEKELALTRT
ncbi:hypothetical protein ZHAS_00010158 [Anopheles sinensis]|uniref:Uncharacterized protein n=1 Tax=Anopheles sinensis TaxID=74873 RepID=A0A084VWS0_ANOSI|nr:hypothetical protein ZHAS_00010158 [Anopheles sinensis]